MQCGDFEEIQLGLAVSKISCMSHLLGSFLPKVPFDSSTMHNSASYMVQSCSTHVFLYQHRKSTSILSSGSVS